MDISFFHCTNAIVIHCIHVRRSVQYYLFIPPFLDVVSNCSPREKKKRDKQEKCVLSHESAISVLGRKKYYAKENRIKTHLDKR